VTTELNMSDKVVNGDLLRFFHPKGFTKVNKKNYTYNLEKSLQNLAKAQKEKKTSIETENGGSTLSEYTTDAPELNGKNIGEYTFPSASN